MATARQSKRPMGPGARLRAHREKMGLSLRAAAEQLGATHPALMAWESGQTTPSAPYRDAIERWTAGLLRANEWPLTPRESAVLGRVNGVRAAAAAGEK